MSSHWRERKRPLCLERRYEFGGYSALRDFLDQAAELSERESFYPDMGFGRDYVNVTIHAEEGSGVLSDARRQFAELLDDLYADPTES
ncbi:MAG: 4a-hydroxytetrahydrobiopterin dehydratase [Gammaproteobacteria bacterium]|nr:4a-hydroxytetrahydrobiopterin dehydratase [Gammaproteobacteria bacterium]